MTRGPAAALVTYRAGERLSGYFAAALAPVLDGSAPVHWPAWLVRAFRLEAIARDALSRRAGP